VHSLHLLFTLSSGDVKSLVLLLDARDFAFDFLYPVFMSLLLSFMVFTFEFANFFQFSFFFNFKKGLFNRLSKEDV